MPRVSSPVFVGRAAELDRLRTALGHAVEGRATTRLVAGEAGIGKTRLVREFLERARTEGTLVLVGECLPLAESGIAYAPFVSALRTIVRGVSPVEADTLLEPGRADLAHLLPDLAGARTDAGGRPTSIGAVTPQARLFEAVFGVLHRLSAAQPIVLVLEDLHWADASTRDLLLYLARTAREERLLTIATYRSDELHPRHPLRPLLVDLARAGNVEEVELLGLQPDEVADQVTGILGGPAAPELVERIGARSGGNPFFAEELVAGGAAQGALPRSLRDAIDDRVAQAGADARHLIRVASVAGARMDHRLLEQVLAWPPERLTGALRDAVEHHVLVPSAPDETPGYAFRHALVREAVYEELLPGERTELHATFARAIAARDDAGDDGSSSAAQVAHHWLMAHDPEHALAAAVAAGRAASAAFAFAEAQAFFERALELWPKVPRTAIPEGLERSSLLEQAAEAAAQSGDARRSIDLVRSALAELDPRSQPLRSGVLHHRLAAYLNEAGDWQAGVAAMERAVELIPIDPPTPERAHVLADLAHSLMNRGRYTESLALAEAALAISRTIGNRMAEARALNVIGVDLACRSDFGRAIPILREGHDLALELGDPVAVFVTGVGLAWALDASARHAEALELARATSERISRLGAAARFGGQLASITARTLYFLGRWDESAAAIDRTLQAGTTRYAVRWLLSNRLRLRAGRGELEEARADQAAYEALGERVIGPDPDLMNLRRAELAIVAEEPVVARGLVRDVLSRMAEPDVDNDARLVILMGLQAEAEEADAARAVGDAERADVAARAAAALAERLDVHLGRIQEVVGRMPPILEADRRLAHALVRRAAGTPDPEAWEAAVEARRVLGRPYELGVVLWQAAAAHLAVRRREDAAAELAEAHAIALHLGARPLRDRIESLARRARIALEGVDTAEGAAERLGLTRREREVLALLADGRSNRQIGEQLYMAESTAGVHVSNILTKLGVTRRSEAAAVAHRLGLSDLS